MQITNHNNRPNVHYVIMTQDNQFMAYDYDTGYPYWSQSLSGAKTYLSIENARDHWNIMKDFLYNSDRAVYPYIAEVLYAHRSSLSFT